MAELNIWSPYFGARTNLQKTVVVSGAHEHLAILLSLAFASITLTLDTALRAFGKGKEFRAWWVVFGLPFFAAILSWVGLWQNRKRESDSGKKVVSMLLTRGAASLAVAQIAYVQFVRDLSWEESGGILGWTLLLSLSAFIAGLFTVRAPRWYSLLTLGISSWMLVVSFLIGTTI